MTVLRVDTIAGIGTTFGPLLDGNLEFNSQNYVILPKGSSSQEGVLRTTEDVIGVGGTYYDNLVLAMPFNAATGLTDVSSRNRNPAAYGNVAISTAQSKYYGSSAYFDGTSNAGYLSLDDGNIGSGDFTVELWSYLISRNSTFPCFISNYTTFTTGSFGFFAGHNNNQTKYSIFLNGDNITPIYSNSNIIYNSWVHLAMVRSGSNITIYVNGTSDGTGTSSATLNGVGSKYWIGASGDTPPNTYLNGYLQDLRIYKGIAKYTADFTPPERIAEIGVGFKTGALRYNTDSNKPELYDGNQWTEVQSSRPDLNGGARGLFGGGVPGPATNTIEYINISSTGNSQDFGDLTTAENDKMSCSSSTRGIFTSAIYTPASNAIDYVTISTTGNAQDFGDLFEARSAGAGCGNQTRGLFIGGDPSIAPNNSDTIDYITIASQGVDAQDFGNLSVGKRQTAACSSPTRGICFGGFSPTNVIEFVTIPTIGNSQDFGDLTVSSFGGSGVSNSVRGLYAAGAPSHQTKIDYITISSLGNSVNFGNLVNMGTTYTGGCSSSTRGVFFGGGGNVMEYVTILTQGNAVDFGDYGSSVTDAVGCSNAHGGL
jgi:hypothetical protein